MDGARKRAGVGLLAAMIGLGSTGCAWGPLQTGAPHLDKALAAIHEAGYPKQMYQGRWKFDGGAASGSKSRPSPTADEMRYAR